MNNFMTRIDSSYRLRPQAAAEAGNTNRFTDNSLFHQDHGLSPRTTLHYQDNKTTDVNRLIPITGGTFGYIGTTFATNHPQ